MGHIQRGHIYEGNCAGKTFFYIRYNITEIVDGEPRRVQRSHQLVEKGATVPREEGGGTYEAKKITRQHAGKTTHPLKPNKALKLKLDAFMLKINQEQHVSTSGDLADDMLIVDFWEQKYLPYCEEVVKLTGKPRKRPSTVRGYKQIWNQHYKDHFAKLTLRQYEPRLGTRFLASLTGTQGRNTLKHIRALGSSIFSRAVTEERIKMNPWHDVAMPEDAIGPEQTQHYTLEEAEDMISALVDHVDCQLVIALSCFLGLRPGEIAALKWEDFDSGSVHIRRSVVRGNVDTPKTPESIATIPLVDPHILIPLALWRKKSGKPKEGWVFPTGNDTPVDLHNLIARVIGPHIEGSDCVRCDKTPKKSKITWKGLYAGRRGACTLVIEKTSKPEVAQALLRHKSMSTTLNVYKKAITPDAFRSGMKALAAATNGKKEA
jgi:integrase